MGHELFSDRFLSRRRAAWHEIGQVVNEDMGAVAALERIRADLNYSLRPTFTEIDGVLVDLPGRSIVRHPTPDDPQHVVMGNVGPEYQLITPREIAEIFDRAVGKPVETIGVLRRGGLFFVTTALPMMDIKGDPVEMYLGIASPMDGVRSVSTEIYPVRVVCANTLRAAQAQAQVSYRVTHDARAKERLGVWLHDAYQQAQQNYDVVKEAFELLAGKTAMPSAAQAIIRRTYPDPRMPRRNAPDDVMAVRLHHFELAKDRIRARREMALALYEGDGTGMDTRAAKGTFWGVFNGITELENYRKGFSQGGVAAEAARVGEAVLFGSRGATMELAFNLCLAAAGGGPTGDPSLN